MTRILIATCDDYINLDQSDVFLQDALVQSGVEVTVLPWRIQKQNVLDNLQDTTTCVRHHAQY
jgi:hypothetical protein